MKNEAILDKLKKILNLAGGKGATPGEVEVAMARAKELAMRHQIELSSIDLTQDTSRPGGIEIVHDKELRIRSKFKQPYHRWVAATLEDVFGIEIVWWGFAIAGGRVVSHIHIIGDATDVAICKVLFPFLEKVFPATLSAAVSAGRLTYAARHMNGCYVGLYRGIVAANKREEAKLSTEDSAKWAMVLVNKSAMVETAKKLAYPKLKSKADRLREMSYEAVAYGKREGEKINLRQVGSGAPAKQIR